MQLTTWDDTRTFEELANLTFEDVPVLVALPLVLPRITVAARQLLGCGVAARRMLDSSTALRRILDSGVATRRILDSGVTLRPIPGGVPRWR